VRRPIAVRVVGPMQWIVYPALLTIAATVVLGTPVELFGLKLPEPVSPMVLAFAWPLIRPSVAAPAALFGLGLFLDLFWGSTLGLWPLCLLAVYAVVLVARNLLAGQETSVLFVWYACCTTFAFLLAYLIVTVDLHNPPSLLALFWQIVPTLLLFPFADWLIQRFDDGDTRFR
jgi:rod shape-determining protein MreD